MSADQTSSRGGTVRQCNLQTCWARVTCGCACCSDSGSVAGHRLQRMTVLGKADVGRRRFGLKGSRHGAESLMLVCEVVSIDLALVGEAVFSLEGTALERYLSITR